MSKVLKKLDNAGPDGELSGIAPAVVSIQVWYVEFSGKQNYFSKSKRYMYFSKMPSSGPRKCYELSLCVAVPPFQLFVEAEFGWKIRKL